MTAGQPRNMTATSVFLIYLNSFPYLKLGYGAALSLILSLLILVLTVVADRRLAPGGAMSDPAASRALAAELPLRRRRARGHYLAAAICIAICTVMVLPLLASVLASLKTDGGGGGEPAHLVPARA